LKAASQKPVPDDRNLVEVSEVLSAAQIEQALQRIASEVLKQTGPDAYLVGIHTGGAMLAGRMMALLQAQTSERLSERPSLSLGAVDITLYRDDVFRGLPKPEIGPTELPESIEGRSVVLVDDVLYTGRTVRAAMDVLADYGRPRIIQLAVLVDRGRREIPIQPDFVGVRIDTTTDQSVRVMLRERGEQDRVVLRERRAP
jgi:pyrimidine operon attenuation protein/uracil phosphoribosyltransferase